MIIGSAVVNNLEHVQCSRCLSLPAPPIHHCRSGHIVCGICSQALESRPLCPLCPLETYVCEFSSLLLSTMALICPNKYNGCNMLLSIEDLGIHLQNCPNLACNCPYCDTLVADKETLEVHFNCHGPVEVSVQEYVTMTMDQGQKRMLYERASKVYFLLSFIGSSLMLNHMSWNESREHALRVHNDDFGDKLVHAGRTSDTRSSSCCVRRLQLPNPEETITVDVLIGKSDVKSRVAELVLKNRDGVECELCCKILTPPVYHCFKSHRLCRECTSKLRVRKKCAHCFQKVWRCRIADSILRNSEWYCSNQDKGCQSLMPIQHYERHVDRCMKTRYRCPMCTRGFEVLDFLREHLAGHPKKELKYQQPAMLIVERGKYLLQEETTNEYFLLILEENRVCLQHMFWAREEEYCIQFEDMGSEWSFTGDTIEMGTIPSLSERFLTIPVQPKSILPIPIIVEIIRR